MLFELLELTSKKESPDIVEKLPWVVAA